MRSYWYAALLPWLAFTIVVRAGGGQGPAWASAVALAAGLGATVVAWRSDRVSALEVASIVTFGALLGAALLLDEAGVEALERFGRPLSTTGLAIGALVSSLRRRPFPTRHLEPAFSAEYVQGPAFATLCREVAVVCGLGASCVTASNLVGSILHTRVGATVFHWLVPLAIVLVAVEVITGRVAGARDDDLARNEMDLDLVRHLGGFLDRPVAPVHQMPPRWG